jgi:HAD superfamily hydrolase (TIGR01509 family)
MTTAPAIKLHAFRTHGPIRAVLFDLSGTLINESYIHHGLTHLAAALHQRWELDPTVTRTRFMVTFRAISHEYADQPFYLMRDVICRTLERLIVSAGHSATWGELIHLEQLLWTAAIPTATPSDGAIETLTRLREAGIRTGIVSYADIPVFEALLKLTGLAGTADVEICSEVARSCKPHPEIFQKALRSINVDPSDAVFVGDDIDTDIVGGNRLGMRTALLSARQFTVGGGPTNDPEADPDHHIDGLLDVIDVVVGTNTSQSVA